MGMTMTQKILAAHAGLESVTAGQLIGSFHPEQRHQIRREFKSDP